MTSKGQTTIPKEVREALGLKDGIQIDWVAKDGLLMGKPRTIRAVDLAGILGRPPNGRHVTIEEMDEAIGKAVSRRFQRKTQR